MTPLKRVLIVGDWLVDEHWSVGRHRSESASRSGQHHSRALHGADCSVRSLCGAGHVATILHSACRGQEKLFEIVGLGLWHEGDEQELRHMLDPKNNVGNTPYRLVPLQRSNDSEPAPHVELFNIAPKTLRQEVGTTRVIRVYERTQYEVALRERLDWERQLGRDSWDRINSELSGSVAAIPAPDGIDAVVIKDLSKGVVTPELIELLRERLPNASWYISSKVWDPEWYAKLPADRVKLLLIPQVAAWQAIRQDIVHSSMWLTTGGNGSKEGFDATEELSIKFKNALVIVLPDGMTLFGRSPNTMKGRPIAYRQTNSGDRKLLSVLPMASVFFPALISHLVGDVEHAEHGRVLGQAANFTDHWMQQEYRRIVDLNWKPLVGQDLDITRKYDGQFSVTANHGWDRSKAHWAQATEGDGVVLYATTKTKKLQLWRSMTEVNGYVACLPDKRRALKKLIEEGRQFSRERSRHMAYMLMDKPGAGKSFLVRCLARQLGMRLLEFNITQMLNRNDLMSMFDKILTDQAQNPEERLLVFVDEINARLEAEHVYSVFLAPLEDGIYVRGGNPFHIKPCFWIFAGTRLPKHPDEQLKSEEGDKGSDFQSRLTLDPFPLWVDPRDKEHMDAASLEKVYIAAATIQRFFPDVQRISTLALSALELLPATIEPRTIARFVKTFQNVQYGKISSGNLPPSWSAGFAIDQVKLSDWEKRRKDKLEGADITIESVPTYHQMQEREMPHSSRETPKSATSARRTRKDKSQSPPVGSRESDSAT